MPNAPKPRRLPRDIFFPLILASVLFALFQTFSKLSPILLSFLLILLISLAVNPVVSRLRAWTGGRKRATGLITAGLVGVMALSGWAFLGPMRTSVTKLTAQMPDYWARLQKPLIRMEKQAVISEEKLQAEVATEIGLPARTPDSASVKAPVPETTSPKGSQNPGTIRSSVSQMLQGVAGSFTGVAFNAAQMAVVLSTVFFGVIFTLMNPRPILGALFSVVPERHHRQALTIARRIGEFLPHWAGSTLLGMVTIGLLVLLIMWPVFGFMDALVLGLIAGLFEAIPFVGPILSAVPALLLAVAQGGLTPMWVLLAYLAVQALENNVILPLIMASGMKLHPLAVIFSMLLCVSAFGVLGVLVAAPLVAIVDILHDELYRKKFLPNVTDAGLERLSRQALHETVSEDA